MSSAEQNDFQKILTQADSMRSSQPLQSAELLRLLEKSQLTSSQQDLFDYLSAYNLSISGQLDQAIPRFKLLTGPSIDNTIRVRALSSLMVMFAGTENWSEGFNILAKLLSEIKTIEKPEIVNAAMISIVVFYNLIGEHSLAITFAEKVLSSTPSPRNECTAKTEQLYAYIKSSISDVSEQDFYDNEESCKKAEESILVYAVYANFAEFYLLTNQINKAISLLLVNVEGAEQTGYHTLTVSYYQQLADYLFLENRITEAESYAKKILSSEAEHQNAGAMSAANLVMYQVTHLEKKYQMALEYYLQYANSQFKKYENENSKLLAIQKAKLNILEKNNQITLLDKENALLKTNAKLIEQQTKNERLALALISLLMVMLVVWLYRTRRFHKQFRKIAQTDDLTGIANRGHFTELAKNSLNACRKSNQPLSFIIFDLDHFKKINDTYGHQIGDWALKKAVKAAHLQCRKNDIIGRIGGEEFGILLPSCDVNKALQLAESCRTAIAAITTKDCGHKFQITASFGVASSATYDYEFDTLFSAADDALYQSKHAGRNKVYCNDEPTSH